ncbi:MAG: hypothetical protein A2X49_00770 [Lentisphaerae bacterium GWF2_52_8]|nr:MAG: hypothetical protein A2X49_00770 [Lentisphaerae bacterium GWF2_52_8]
MFENPTYIVLGVPKPCAERLRKLRKIHDPARAKMDVEITIAGSSGVGTVSAGQDIEIACRLLREVSRQIKPFRASFGPPGRFPGTGIFYFSLLEHDKFLAAHKLVANCGLLFNPTPYPFLPHCTVKLAAQVSAEEEFDLLSLKPPCGSFVVDSLSMYSLSGTKQKMLFHSRLGA